MYALTCTMRCILAHSKFTSQFYFLRRTPASHLPTPRAPLTPPGMQAHDSVSMTDESAVWEENRQVSKFADGLQQLEEGVGRWGRSIPSDPTVWACDETGVTENLWLNLSTGFIGSGRQVGPCMRHRHVQARMTTLWSWAGTWLGRRAWSGGVKC